MNQPVFVAQGKCLQVKKMPYMDKSNHQEHGISWRAWVACHNSTSSDCTSTLSVFL